MRHPVTGDLQLSSEAMELAAGPGLTVVTYSTEPGVAPRWGYRCWLAGVEKAKGTDDADRLSRD